MAARKHRTILISAHAAGMLITIAILMIGASDALAYEDYSSGCQNCHGDFTADPYISLSDGANWGDSLHNVHRIGMLGGDCNTCHSSGARVPVFLDSSIGGSGLEPISCVGCHGRDEDNGNATSTGTSQPKIGSRNRLPTGLPSTIPATWC